MKLFERVARACGDPGSFLPRRPDESVTRWSARAVVHVLSEPRPLAEWTEEDGSVLWWRLPVDEDPRVGSPLHGDWPCVWAEGWQEEMSVFGADAFYTHWTPLPWPAAGDPEPFVVSEADPARAAEGSRVRPLAPAELLPTLYPRPGTVRS